VIEHGDQKTLTWTETCGVDSDNCDAKFSDAPSGYIENEYIGHDSKRDAYDASMLLLRISIIWWRLGIPCGQDEHARG
jgi:hypothetical protein